jgi:hypothetical protein
MHGAGHLSRLVFDEAGVPQSADLDLCGSTRFHGGDEERDRGTSFDKMGLPVDQAPAAKAAFVS